MSETVAAGARYCMSCGTQLASGARYCARCGALVPDSAGGTTAPAGAGMTEGGGYAVSARNSGQMAFSATTAYAGFWKRAIAYIIDGIVTTIAGFIGGFVIGFVLGLLGLRDDTMLSLAGGIVQLVLTWLYFAIMESSEGQATLGKMALSIKVTDLNGDRISFGRATGRHFAKIISGLILGIGYIMAGFTEKKQALHDMIASTLVVSKS